jgi:hypothetical protein
MQKAHLYEAILLVNRGIDEAVMGWTPIRPVSAKERGKISQRIKKRHDRLRRRYPEVYSKVVNFITHSVEDGMLYRTVRFKDKINFSLRYACEMFVVGADLYDAKTGDYEVIREYMRPISRQERWESGKPLQVCASHRPSVRSWRSLRLAREGRSGTSASSFWSGVSTNSRLSGR